MVQRTAACLVTGNYITTSVITKMFKDLQWPILQENRQKAKIIMFDRIVYYLSEIPSQTYLVPSLASLTKRGHDIRFLHPYSRIQSLTVLFPSAIRLFNNNFPCNAAIASRLEGLKDSIKSIRMT